MNTCNVVSISLFEKEKLMNNVESLIKIKRKNLIEKKKEINKKKKINEYLHYVELDYQTYLQHFKNQKQKQIDSFNLINNYLQMLSHNENFAEQQYHLLQKDQNKIIEEIEILRDEISEITNL
jgi:hypothetical protein